MGSALGEFKPVRVAYAAFWLRVAAVLIDSFVLIIPSFVIVMLAVFGAGLKLPDPDAPITQFPTPTGVFIATEGALLILQWLYFAIMESSPWRGTLGKRALGIAVTDLNGKRISFGRASSRFFGKLVSSATFLVGYVMAAFTQKRQALHDIMAGTLVVKMP
ncbi:MAG: RDD family protein [Chthoniobacterales bacterium]